MSDNHKTDAGQISKIQSAKDTTKNLPPPPKK